MLAHSDFQQVHEYSAGGLIALDKNGHITYANPTAINDFFALTEYIGQPVNLLFNGPNKPTFSDDEFTVVNANSKATHVLISSKEVTDKDSQTLTYWFIRNITALKKKEDLLAYLNKATSELSRARDTRSALSKIPSLIVPKFANWFSIDLIKGNKLEELVLAHEDPEMIQWARKYREIYPTDLNSNNGTAQVARTGEPSFVPIVTEEMVRASIKDPDQLDAILRLNLQSVITVAIFNKETITGVISFITSEDGHYYDEADLRFAQNLANHIGLALENAQLNEQLEKTQLQLTSALSLGMVGTWKFDIENNKLYLDENLSRMFGVEYTPLGTNQDDIRLKIHPDDVGYAEQQLYNAITHKEQYEIEYRVIINDTTRWFFSRGQAMPSEDENAKIFTGVIIDVTERKEAELALKESNELFRFLADAIPHKMWTSNPEGRATYYNKGWYDYTETTDFEELRSQVWDLIHPDDRKVAEVEWPKAMQSGNGIELESRFKRHDGEYRWHLSRYSAHRDANGKIQLWVGTSTDIHEQKASEQRKDEFLSIASHELKTPLTSIKAFNQLMKRANTEKAIAGFIDKSAEHIYRLEKLISDLLDVTKLNAGKMVYANEPFDFNRMLQNSIESLQYNTTHQILLQSAPNITYTGDEFRLEQVMNNLLSNAIKYSPQANQILVNCYIDQDSIIVSVQDFGIGIAHHDIDKLFDRYYRVDNTAMRFEGLGLGLYISSEILKRHNGSLWIESERGKGSTFYFRLPLRSTEVQKPLIKTDDHYQDEFITIKFNRDKHWLEVDWTGFQDMASVQAGCMVMLGYLKLHKTDRIVNDNTHVKGNWSDAVDWVGHTWFPMMEQAGLKYFAHIFSPSTFSKLAAQKSIDIMAGIITTQYFTDIELAREWVDSCPH